MFSASFSYIMHDENNPQRWEFLLQKKGITPTLFLLHPLMEYVFRELRLFSEKHQVKKFLHESLIFETTRLFFVNNLLQVIEHVCIYEFCEALQHGAVKGFSNKKKFTFFCRKLGSVDNFEALFLKYQPLKDVVNSLVEQHIHSRKTFLLRFKDDYYEIKKHFGFTDNCVVFNTISRGDIHRFGFSTEEVELLIGAEQNRMKLMYKHRNLKLDIEYHNFLNWFNKRSGTNLKTFKILNKKTYGWVEYIPKLNCKNTQDVRRFYQKIGYLLCIHNLLYSYDIHAENIIAHGNTPIIIDLECLFSPSFNGVYTDFDEIDHILKTMILPLGSFDKFKNVNFDISGISTKQAILAPYYKCTWKHIGSKKMQAKYVKSKRKLVSNMPTIKNKRVNFKKYKETIISGFTLAYDVFLRNKDSLLTDKTSPLARFKKNDIRLIFRPTAYYQALLNSSYHSALLYSKEKRNEYFSLIREVLRPHPEYADIVESEIEDLTCCNIPIFTTGTDQNIVYNSRYKKINFALKRTGMENVMGYVAHSLSKEDLFKKQEIIRKALND